MTGDIEQLRPGAPSAKEDPEALVLRGRPRRVVRFRRGLIISITASLAGGLIGLTWLALDPPSFRNAAHSIASEDSEARAPSDALAGAPSGYGDVPRLGPPLPGDLGRPILEHEQGASGPGPSGSFDPALAEAERDRAAAQAERQRVAAARQAARSSAVMVELREAPAPAAAAPPGDQPREGGPAPAAADDPSVPPAQQRKIEFTHSEEGEVNPHSLRAAPSPWTLSAGTVIPASLMTGLNSDLPGAVLAQVTENVSDSATGRTTLVPQGARLIGSYDSIIAYGQRRALVVWKRIVFPDGSSIDLDTMPATDPAGYAGLKDKVDSHGWQLLKGVLLSTLLGVGTQLSLGSSESDLVRAIRESAQQNGANAGNQVTARSLDIQPTLTVRPGWPVRAVVNKDLVLQPWRE